jgi:signal transduction histidine kinase
MSDQEDTADATLLMGAAAHEIKNALGPLAMTLQLAERQAQAAQPVPLADLAFARAQVKRIGRLVEDLMDLTRADLDELAFRPVAVELAPLVEETVEIFRRGHARAVKVSLPSTPLLGAVDRDRVQQVLLNLLENADRYSPPEAAVAVVLAPVGAARARVTVLDRGPGVAPAERARIFDRFVRGAAADGTRGLGLGLYLCRVIVERHGGAIGVDGAPGGGSSFWVELPGSDPDRKG